MLAAAFGAVLTVPAAARADCGAQDARSFGATGDGCTDDRNAIQAAADAAAVACGGAGGYVALSPGRYRINSRIRLAHNVGLVGSSPADTQILVSDQACPSGRGTFDMAQTEVILLAPIHGSPTGSSTAPISGFGVNFRQPDVTDRALMTRYPVAIRADVRPYLRVSNVWITNAWNGISLRGDAAHGNSGGSTFDNIYMSVYNVGFDIDDAQDSMRFSRIHCAHNNLMTANQKMAMAGLETTCIRSGRLDDLHITDSLFLMNTGVHLYQSPNGVTVGSITGTDFDSAAQLRVSAGVIGLSNWMSTNPAAGHPFC